MAGLAAIGLFSSVFGSRDSSKCRNRRRWITIHREARHDAQDLEFLSEHRSGGSCFYRCPDISGFHNGCTGHHVISFRWWFPCPVMLNSEPVEEVNGTFSVSMVEPGYTLDMDQISMLPDRLLLMAVPDYDLRRRWLLFTVPQQSWNTATDPEPSSGRTIICTEVPEELLLQNHSFGTAIRTVRKTRLSWYSHLLRTASKYGNT